MVVLNKIYTRSGDQGRTRLATGELVEKFDLRVEAYGAVDELNAVVGVARQALPAEPLDAMLARIQNELFDLGADLATPDREGAALGFEALRILESQALRLETEIDQLNADLTPLTSFILPGGGPVAAALHLARTVCRRAERLVVKLEREPDERVAPAVLIYLNRLSDLFFVMSRWANDKGAADVLWTPGATR